MIKGYFDRKAVEAALFALEHFLESTEMEKTIPAIYVDLSLIARYCQATLQSSAPLFGSTEDKQ